MTGGLATRWREIRETVGPLCIGIDPSAETLTAWGLTDTAEGAREFARAVINAAHTRVGLVKPQVAYFERFGSEGVAALERTIADAHSAGLAVIADAKRGDIGSTMEGYATAWLGDGPLGSDAMTVSPYLGVGALEPAFAQAERTGGTVFVLVATSNPEAARVQRADADGLSVAAAIALDVRTRTGSTNTAGLVVGATRTLRESGLTDDDLQGMLILAPGFGHQGARLDDLTTIFGSASATVIPTVSRSVTADGPTHVANAIDRHRRELGL